MKQATRLNLMLLCNIKLKQANYKKYFIFIIYIQVKLCDYCCRLQLNLIKIFIIWDVKYPASAR